MKIKPTSKRGSVVVELNRCDESLFQPAPTPFKLKKILVPIDFSHDSLKALRYAIPFAKQFGATLYLVHVVEAGGLVNDLPDVAIALAHDERPDVVKARLTALADQEIDPLVPVKVEVRGGKPFQEIAALAATSDIDLIIIATRGHTGLKHVFLGSTAERVVRHAHCPVLVVRKKEHDFVE